MCWHQGCDSKEGSGWCGACRQQEGWAVTWDGVRRGGGGEEEKETGVQDKAQPPTPTPSPQPPYSNSATHFPPTPPCTLRCATDTYTHSTRQPWGLGQGHTNAAGKNNQTPKCGRSVWLAQTAHSSCEIVRDCGRGERGGGEVYSGAAGSGGADRPRTYIRSASTVQKIMIKQKRLHLGNK